MILQLIDDGKATRQQIEDALKAIEAKIDDIQRFYFAFEDSGFNFSDGGVYYRFHDYIRIPNDIDEIKFSLNKKNFERNFDVFFSFFGKTNQDIEATYDNESCLNGVILELFLKAWDEKMYPLEPLYLPTSETLHIIREGEDSFFQLEKAKLTPPNGVISLPEGPNACVGERMTYIYWRDTVWKVETNRIFL